MKKAYFIRYIDGTELTVWADCSRTLVGTVQGTGWAGKLDRIAGKESKGLYLSVLVHLSEQLGIIESQKEFWPEPSPTAC